MLIQIITLFPEMFDDVLSSSILGRARTKKLVDYKLINLRDFGIGPRKQVDDTPYGGGSGMILKPEPLFEAIVQAKNLSKQSKVILPSPRGKIYNQKSAADLSKESGIILICPRYEGYDERIVNWVDHTFSIGEYVLSGGEIPAMLITDSIVRLIPGVLGNSESLTSESYLNGPKDIEYPQYTKPNNFRGLKVPNVLQSGNHAEIRAWQAKNKK